MNELLLGAKLAGTSARVVDSTPTIFDLSDPDHGQALSRLIDKGDVRQVCDEYEDQQRELYAIRHPERVYAPDFEEEFRAHYRALAAATPPWQHGRWVYFPWRFQAVHILAEDEYRLVRSARNQNLVTVEEQETFYNARIGIAGLSVGSSFAFAIALSGGGKRMRLADMDRLALTNTNRILAGADRLGLLKVEMAARTIYEINPYAELELFPQGLTTDNAAQFCEGLDAVVDAMDNLAMKYRLREHASRLHIPIVMGADNGDNAVFDIERYDLDPQTPFFHGRMGEVSFDQLNGLDKFGIGKTITKFVGPENVTERMQQSLMAMGKSIVSWPQLDQSPYNCGQSGSYVADGCAIENLVLAATVEGYRADVACFPTADDAEHVATLTLHKAEAPVPDPLAAFIDARVSNRKPYAQQPLDDAQRQALLDAAGQAEFGELRLVEDRAGRERLGRVGATNEEVMLANRSLHAFFFRHLSWTLEEDRRNRIGFYIKTLELPPPVQKLFRLIRHWPLMRVLAVLGFPRMVARQNAALNASCSAIGALLMDGTQPLDYVRIGRTAQRVWLAATALGLSLQPLTGVMFMRLAIEADTTGAFSARERRLVLDACATAERLFDARGRRIAFMFRVGHADPPSAHASRFPLEQVVEVRP